MWGRHEEGRGTRRCRGAVRPAVVYYKGDGVPADFSEAAEWFRKAAEQGHVQAEYNLGVMYRDGDGVERDLAEAAKWFLASAAQGNAQARGVLAELDAALQGSEVVQGSLSLQDYTEIL